jgi:ABC-2 type transport system permease protein
MMKKHVALNHAIYELRNILRNPEQLLLIIGTPTALLVLFRDQSYIFSLTLASCALASSFTSVAINTAFAKRYGTLKYISVTPVGMKGLAIGQTLVGCLLLVFQIPYVSILALALDIEISLPLNAVIAIPFLVAIFTLLAFNFASLMSAEKVLAFANITFLAILASGFKFVGSNYSFLHPVSGITFRAGISWEYPLTLFVYTGLMSFALCKFFKWID